MLHIFILIRVPYLGRPECYTWTAERSLLDKVGHRCSGTDCYRDGHVSSLHPHRKQSILPMAAMNPSYHRLQ